MLHLALHPDSRCDAVTRIEVELIRPRPQALVLRYGVTGAIAELSLAPVTTSTRADELWRRSCFEAFVGVGAGYYEFNFAPSTQWAAYRFGGYRQGMSKLGEISAPRIEVKQSAERYELQASLELSGLQETPSRLGLAAVIEEMNGEKSYWALAHPPGKPDFHHAAGFVLELP